MHKCQGKDWTTLQDVCMQWAARASIAIASTAAFQPQEAEAQRREQAARSKQFSLGKLAYGKGLYPESARLFEVALDHEGPFSKLGGEIQLWQALAYQVQCCCYCLCHLQCPCHANWQQSKKMCIFYMQGEVLSKMQGCNSMSPCVVYGVCSRVLYSTCRHVGVTKNAYKCIKW